MLHKHAMETASPPLESSNRGSLWPEEFCSPRTAMMIALALLGWGSILLVLAYMNRLHGVRILLAWMMNLPYPQLVSTESWDIAVVLWLLPLAAGAGVVHPSLGLIVLALFRPWHDGYTYFEDNVYFLWGIWILFVIWAVRQLFRGERFRMGAPALLLSGFLASAFVTMISSIQFDNSYRQIMLWMGYLALFILTCNTLRSRKVMGIVLVGMVVSIAAETLFSILQFHFMLSTLRAIAKDPRILQYFFDTNVMTPELARRLNVNRAFGTMLFPNALAGFLILSIPYSVVGAILGWHALLPAWNQAENGEDRMSRRYKAIAAAFLTWFVLLITVFVSGLLIIMWQTPEMPVLRIIFGLGAIGAILALAPAVLVFWVTDNHGIRIGAMAIRAAGLSILTPMQLYALWITYSRGAMLSLALAAVAGLALWFLTTDRSRWWRLGVSTAGALLIIGLMTAQTESPAASEQSAAQATASAEPASTPPAPSASAKRPSLTEVTEEGIDLTLRDLMNPASMALRVSYWRVGWSMFWNHFWTGVGLGNFGIAYIKYQYIGAGPVRLAHNGYLQAFCETGVIGGLFLMAFWAYFVLWGARRILRQPKDSGRLLLIGLYVGVLAFLLHAGIDIHFQHPSLMMIAFLFCGVFYALASSLDEPPPEGAPWKRQMMVLPMLLLAALAVGMSMRVWQRDVALDRMGLLLLESNSKNEMDQRFGLAQFMLTDLLKNNAKTPDQKPQLPFHSLMTLIPEAQELMDFGVVYAPLPDTPKGMKRLQPGEIIPENAVLLIKDPLMAFQTAWKHGLDWVAELERIDRRFPYSPDLALHIAQWYDLLVSAETPSGVEDKKREYADKLVIWSQEALWRSPLHPDMHLNLAQAFWTLGNLNNGLERFKWLERALDEFKQASLINRATAFHLRRYLDALNAVGEACRQSGNPAQAEAYAQQAASVEQEIKAIRAANQKLKKKKAV